MIMARDEKTMEGMQIALDTTKIDNERLRSFPKPIISEQISLAHLYIARVSETSP